MKMFLLLILCSYTFSQNYTLSGFVKDKSNKESLISVSIYIEELGIGTVSNKDGYYVISDIPNKEFQINVQSVGYKKISQNITFNDDTKFNFYLEEDIIEGEAVEVVAENTNRIDLLFKEDISKVSLTNSGIRQIPQVAESDLMRSLQTLPGVLSISDFSSALYVRGGTSDQNLYLVDGADIYNPEHAFGLFSTFNTDAIKVAELLKGGFTAEHGARLSSVLDVINLDGNREQFEGNASVSLLAAKTTLQFPLSEKSSVSASIRRTYFDQILATIDDLPDYYFWDGNVKAFYDFDEKNNFSLSFFMGRDDLDFLFNKKDVNDNGVKKEGFNYQWGNKTSSFKWTHIFSPKLFSNIWVNYSTYDSEYAQFNGFINEKNEIRDLTLKTNMTYEYSQNLQFKFGFEWKSLNGDFDQETQEYLFDIGFESDLYMGYGSIAWKPLENLDIEAGLRLNHFKTVENYKDLAPRLAVKYKLNETTNLKISGGKFFQYLHQAPRLFFANVWVIANKNQKRSSSDHAIFGLQKLFNNNEYEIELESYFKTYNNIYRFNRFTYRLKPDTYKPDGTPIYNSTKNLFDRGDGESFGIELIAKKNKGYVTGWLSYAYSDTKYKFDGINNGEFFSPRHDRTHSLNLLFNINYSRWLKQGSFKKNDSEWILGGNLVYGTGQAITAPSSMYFRNINPGEHSTQWHSLYADQLGNFRLPAYMRLDVSVKYLMKYPSMTVEPYLQVFNIGNRKNVWFMEYENSVSGGTVRPEIVKNSMFPLLPTLGVNFTF